MSNQIEQIRAEIERRKKVNLEEGETGWTCVDEDDEILHFIDQLPAETVPADVQEAAKNYADEQLAGHNQALAESRHTRYFKMGYVCFAGYEMEEAFADGAKYERERLMKEAPVTDVIEMHGSTETGYPFVITLGFPRIPRFELSGKPVRVIIEEIK